MHSLPVRIGSLAAALFVVGTLGACSQLDSAMSKGCNALRSAADAYEAGDREAFEAAFPDTMELGVAVQYTDTESPELQNKVGTAASGAEALHSAAYAPVEKHEGEEVWQGREMRAWQTENLRAGLDACEGYS